MKEVVDIDSEEMDSGPSVLSLRPVHGRPPEEWTVQCKGEIMSLFSEEGVLVMTFPREEAAHHLRFDRDLFHGLVLTMEAGDAFPLYRFKCLRQDMHRLLDWLPRKRPEQVHREVRRDGLALLLLAFVFLLIPQIFFWGWAVLFALEGLAMILFPRRFFYAINGLLMMTASLAYLFLQPPPPIFRAELVDFAGPLRTFAGSLLLIWAIHQWSLLGANYQIRLAQRGIDGKTGDSYVPVAVVRKAMWAITAVLMVQICQWASLLVHTWAGKATLGDWVLWLSLTGVTLGVFLLLCLRPRAGYFETRFAGQFTICLGTVYTAGSIVYPLENRLPFAPDVLWNGLFTLSEPYIWAPLIGLILLFNHWFNRQVERESGSGLERGD